MEVGTINIYSLNSLNTLKNTAQVIKCYSFQRISTIKFVKY